MKNPIKGALIATAAAALFVAAPNALAEEGTDYVKCAGVNGCKGQGACAGADHECAGHNECKGKGWIKAGSEEECTEKGGQVS